ncbi:hypothetical protein [Parvibaculum sp.]|uniref:hypothetical protein n=2 Tax=Parvibaculum sp. TaxID=2024848 RepID=UPI0032990716
MKRFAAPLIALALIVPLGACGFSPLYAERNGSTVTSDLMQLDVSAPEDELGREIKYSLLDVLSPTGIPPANALYRVEVAPVLYSEDVAIERDAEVTRKNLALLVPFRLVNTDTKETLLRSTSRARSSYNRVPSEYANIVAADDARERIAKAAANDIKLQLSIYFDRASGSGS